MKKKASLKKKMEAQDKGENITSNFEVPEVRQSVLRKQFQIKLEKLINNLGGSNVDMAEIGGPSNNEYPKKGSNQSLFMSASQEQFNLSNFAASEQASLNSNMVLHPTKKMSGIVGTSQPNVPEQNQDPKNCVNTTKKLLTMEASTAASRGSRQYMTRSKGSIHIQDPKRQPMKKAVVEISSTKLPKKNTVAEDDNSRAKQQPVRMEVSSNNNSSVNKQSMNWAIGEEDKTRTRKQPMKRVVLEDDWPRTVDEYAMKKTKTLPMCRSMLVDEFLIENGGVGEQELGNESSDEEQNVMVGNSSAKQPMKDTGDENDNSRAKQQPMRRAVTSNNNLSANKQSVNRLVGEENRTRARKHPMKRAVIEEEVHGSAMKKTKTLPMCRSMLIEEFLKEIGEVGEEELGDECYEDEQSVMVGNSSAKQPMKNTVAVDDNSRAKQQSMRMAAASNNNSSANKQSVNRVVSEEDKTRARKHPMKRAVIEGDRPRAVHESTMKRTKILPMIQSMLIEEFLKENGDVGEEELGDETYDEEQRVIVGNSRAKQPMKNTVAVDDNSRAKQQPMRRAAASNNNSSANKQSVNRVVGEEDKTRARKHPMKRAVIEGDRPRAVNESTMKKTKTLPMIRSMLIEEFLKENGEVGEEELGDESYDEEQRVMVGNSSAKQPMKNTVAEDHNSRAKQQPMRRAAASNNNSSANKQSVNMIVGEEDKTRTRKQPMKRAVIEDDRPRTLEENAMKKTKTLPMWRSMLIEEFLKENGEVGEEDLQDENSDEEQNVMAGNSSAKQPMKNTVAEDDNSRAKQKPMRRAVAETNNSSANKQSMNRVVGEEDKTRTRKEPMKKVVLEDDRLSPLRTVDESAIKTKPLPMCRAMLIEEFLKENGEVGEEELGDDSSDEEQNVMGQEESAHQEEVVKTKGTSKRRTRGPTLCLNIHARNHNDRQEVVLDEYGEPIGPDGQTVSDLSHFLGTIARNANFCPLIYTNFKALVKDNEELIWGYVNDKFIIPDKGRKAVFSCINDAWRRHKCRIKRNYFLKYSSMKERLKHCPTTIPKAHFKQLMTYWRNSTIQSISQKNAMNRAKQKYVHRMGSVNFARIRAQLRAKKGNGEEITQPEMFIETRQSRKGKEVDKETQSVIAKLRDSIQNSSGSETFRSLFGKEKSGKVRCFGKTLTPTVFKRNEEIAAIKKQHSDEMTSVKREMEGLKFLVKSLLKQQNPNFDEGEVNGIMATALGNEKNATPHSSTSNHVPHREKFLALQNEEEEDIPQGIEEEEDEFEGEENIPQGIGEQGLEGEGEEEEEGEEDEE
ncbi:uncharacterized protein LOC130740706 [Lotus japonicus]|uniref:uncharacterized protein LOC130740706 n=1 Tax=Lotus japonicus TaxID=34305 RepID=UPI00258F884B|nr:uncharacterized protein LOC130740706 [Lotus japonicus]